MKNDNEKPVKKRKKTIAKSKKVEITLQKGLYAIQAKVCHNLVI